MSKMKIKLSLFLAVLLFLSCDEDKQKQAIKTSIWADRTVALSPSDTLHYGKTYLSVYSQIYSLSEHKTQSLTAMISIRNTSEKDTIYLLRAEYFDTHGVSVKSYFDKPVYLLPLETTEIVIEEKDDSGGTGSNFIFEWKIPEGCPEPFFEGVMSSILSQQGLSFTTQGVRVE
jgi:hypothetical protein